jgi:hypothetical protein
LLFMNEKLNIELEKRFVKLIQIPQFDIWTGINEMIWFIEALVHSAMIISVPSDLIPWDVFTWF